MRALSLLSSSEGSLLADYASRMSETLVRNRANMEVRAARAEAENAIKARSEFLANMNHELRTPLNAIIGFASMLRDGDDYQLDNERRAEYAEYIIQSADLLLGHINTILEVAAFESGKIEIVDDEMSLDGILDEALTRAQVRAKAADVTITRRDEGEDIPAFGDCVRAGQAVDHILQAAINSCDKGGRILVRATYDEKGRPEIAVRDDGRGLTTEELNEALDAFSSLHRGLDRAFNGPGIGYAIAKSFIEIQGGQFHIKSRPGKGSLVRVLLREPIANVKNNRGVTPPNHDADEELSTTETTHAA